MGGDRGGECAEQHLAFETDCECAGALGQDAAQRSEQQRRGDAHARGEEVGENRGLHAQAFSPPERPIAPSTNTMVRPSITSTSQAGTPTGGCIATAPASRK